VTNAPAIRVPTTCSPLEAVYLLAVLLHRQEESLSRLPEREVQPLEECRADLRELHGRTRAIVDQAEGGPLRDILLQALLLKAGLEPEAPAAPKARQARSRAQELAVRGRELARQCGERFADSPWADEFRLCGECWSHLGLALSR
jgi:hypothetical protein